MMAKKKSKKRVSKRSDHKKSDPKRKAKKKSHARKHLNAQGNLKKKAPAGKSHERDSKGRLLPGHTQPGPGNPYACQLKEYREKIRKAISPDDVVLMLSYLKDRAKAGDMMAAKVWLDRIGGKSTIQPIFPSERLNLPAITSPETAREAIHKIMTALDAGVITVTLAGEMFKMVRGAAETISEEEAEKHKEELVDKVRVFLEQLNEQTKTK